ncbi:hypothetical protein MLD38_028397 [Melastoma candidum]|uniref:Uncharacterized protein n=1 Tax=Melastoma candidum TaxID=119954 RepID=A0ACB9N1S0_9MYRT|nr:hypothetical protein MLD38_028397 [Melastoma candidum]
MQEDGKKMKVKKGWLAVQVGTEEEDASGGGGPGIRFVIPISYLYHPLFKRLLDRAHETYGYHSAGPLRLPCSVDDFQHLRWRIEKESSGGSGRHHHHLQQQQHHHNGHGSLHFNGSLSFRSC